MASPRATIRSWLSRCLSRLVRLMFSPLRRRRRHQAPRRLRPRPSPRLLSCPGAQGYDPEQDAEFTTPRSNYRMGRTLGAGTYGIVREADSSTGKVAVKIILKKNVRGNEAMVLDELSMLQNMHHPHIVRFVDWFESRDKYYIVTQLALGGELFDRICEKGRFTEKDAARTIRQVFEAVEYLHQRNVVHRGMSPLILVSSTADF